MVILHIVSGSLQSGAGKGSFLLHRELLKIGLDSRILVLKGTPSKILNIEIILNSPFKSIKYSCLRFFEKAIIKFLFFNNKEKIENFSLGIFGIGCFNHPWYKEADIIHLHWINGILSINQISKISKPIIWTMRDMWPFTSGYHYNFDLLSYKNNKISGKSQLISNIFMDRIQKFKLNKFKKKSILFIGITNWISNEAKKSLILKEKKIKTILNIVDNNSFYPNNEDYLYKKYFLDKSKKIILLGANKLEANYKGYGKFLECLEYLDPKIVQIVCFGNISQNYLNKIKGFTLTKLGYISNNKELSKIYSGSYVFAAPSILEAFGKTIVESMLCGTPCIVFDNSGPSELVIHKKTGFVANVFSSSSFSEGIKWLLNLEHKEYQTISKQCLDYSRNKFNPKIAANEYYKNYLNLLKKQII